MIHGVPVGNSNSQNAQVQIQPILKVQSGDLAKSFELRVSKLPLVAGVMEAIFKFVDPILTPSACSFKNKSAKAEFHASTAQSA